MTFQTMPESRYLKGFGIVVFLITVGYISWRNGGIVGGKTTLFPKEAASLSQDGSIHDQQEGGSGRRTTRDVNADSRVRSLLQIMPGEVGNIRIPQSGFSSLITEDLERRFDEVPLIPLTREQAIHGLEEILRNGDTLGSKVDVANGKIVWKGDGITVNGDVTEMEPNKRRLHLEINVTAPKVMLNEVIMTIEDHSFFLVRAPGADAGGVLLVFGESPAESSGEPKSGE
jgi:hypothetical protein